MSGLVGTIGGLASGVGGAASSLTNAGSDLDALFNGGYGAREGLGIWAATLQPASFRGVPFGVMLSSVKTFIPH